MERSTTAAKVSALTLSVYTSSAETFHVTSTLVQGEKDAILVDAQLTLTGGRSVVEMIKKSGKNLQAVYITHGHPDHYWGINAIHEAFPAARIVSIQSVIDIINRFQVAKYAQWHPVFGSDIPENPIIPTALEGETLELEGNVLKIWKGQGDVEGSSAVVIRSLNAVIAGDTVYNGVHPWTLDTDKAGRTRWAETLNQLMMLQPGTVVAGHKNPKAKDDLDAIIFTKKYIEAFDTVIESSHSAEEVIKRMNGQFPGLLLEPILQMAANALFPKQKPAYV
ncbi:MAG: MBL fold metallo-hydrolase [Endomicrobiales bacterium]